MTTPRAPTLTEHTEEGGAETTKSLKNGVTSPVVIVKIPSGFTEEKVKTLMGAMEAQFEGTGHKVIFAPEEVDVRALGCCLAHTKTTYS